MINERLLRRALIVLALIALGAGLAASAIGQASIASRAWITGTVPVILVLGASMVRDLAAGRMGVDAVAFVSMTAALSLGDRAHREIQHLATLLMRLSTGLCADDADRYLIRDAQRVIESIEALVRLHNAQEEDIYEHAMPA